ncbi:5-(carboxyamino)imidazole ribonucleotide mutase [Candidatus Undinarchaeota archaeon]
MIDIILGSESDRPIADKAEKVLTDFGAEFKTHIASAHRTPEKLKEIVQGSKSDVFIAIAGLSAALPGAVASMTTKPVIGVPVNVKLDGLDSLLSIMQMPPKVPVACVGIDRGDNAAYLAIQILSIKDEEIAKKLADFKDSMSKS